MSSNNSTLLHFWLCCELTWTSWTSNKPRYIYSRWWCVSCGRFNERGGVGVWGGKSAAMMEQDNLNVSVNMFVSLMFVQGNREKGDFKKSPCLFGSLWFSSLWLNLWAFEEELLVSLLRPSFYFHRVSLSAVSHWVEFGVFLPVKTKLTSWFLQLHDKNVGLLLGRIQALVGEISFVSCDWLVLKCVIS